jgi:predicted AAA+ superfamily ATPase
MGSVIKKRGRPVGSKNKPKVKTVRLTQTQVDLCKKMGVTPAQYAKSLVKIEKQEKAALARKKRALVKKVNWELLAKQLQTALNDEFLENKGLSERINNLNYQVANLEHQAIGYRAVVSYLENQIANHTV